MSLAHSYPNLCTCRSFNIKALFRKIAAALPGMEALNTAKQVGMAVL